MLHRVWGVVLCSLIFLSTASGNYWRKDGIGRVSRLKKLTHSEHVVVASEKGVVARLAIDSLEPQWRAPSVDHREAVDSIAVLESPQSIVLSVLRIRDSEDGRGKIVRAFDLLTGTILWNLPGCAVGLPPVDEANSYAHVVPIRSCSNGKVTLHLAVDGTDVTDRTTSSKVSAPGQADENAAQLPTNALPTIEWFPVNSGSGQLSPSGDIVWRDIGEHQVQDPRGPGSEEKPIEIVSRRNAKLSLRAVHAWVDITSRHEGMAHATSAMFITSSTRKGSAPDTLITLSAFGSLFGYDLDTGALRWQHDIQLNDKSLNTDNCKLLTGHRYHAVVVCIHQSSPAAAHSTVSIVDGSSGGGLMGLYLHDFHASHAFVHHECCSAYHTCVHLVDASGTDKVVSTCDDTFVENTKWHLHNPTYFSVSQSKTMVEGHREGRVSWRFQLSPDLQISTLAFAPQPHPASRMTRKPAVRVTGDRRVLYKYTDPSTLVLLAAPEAESTHALTAIIIHGTSGAVLKAIEHVNASKPFTAVRNDNWIAYSYWNTYLLQQELHVVDMYEQKKDTNFVREKIQKTLLELVSPLVRVLGIRSEVSVLSDTASCPAGGAEGDGTCVAKAAETGQGAQVGLSPELVHTAFLLSHQVRIMDVSETEGGVTEKSILMALSSGQVVSLSRLAIDARRPLGGPGVESAEGLAPYYPYLSFLPPYSAGKYLTKDTMVTGIQGMAVAPVPDQESSSHIAAFGTDLFYRKYAPAGNFDTLPDDFRYAVVIASVILISAAAYYSEYALERKRLAAAW